MKRTILLLAGAFLMGATAVSADNDRAVTLDQLPQRAQQFIRQHFAGEQVAFAKRERDFLEETRYEVVFTGGAKVEFRRNGDWNEVDCRYAAVPEAVLPEMLRGKIEELYPGVAVLRIDRDDRGAYEVRLSNGLELSFDRRGGLTGIDD